MAINLVTSGCSFTAYDGCWPYWLVRKLIQDNPETDISLINTGYGGQGNEIISRKAIYSVNKLLKKGIKSKDILVGIMWSGADRKSFYSDEKTVLQRWFGVDNPLDITNDDYERDPGGNLNIPPVPLQWPTNDRYGRYYLITPGSADPNNFLHSPGAENWYKNFHNSSIAVAQTYENVLRTQWYLEKHNIKYFMQTYTPWWDKMPDAVEGINTLKTFRRVTYDGHPQVEYLKEMIDWNKFTDTSCYQWIKDNSDLEWNVYDPIRDLTRPPGDGHPTSQQQEQYTLDYLYPILKDKGIV